MANDSTVCEQFTTNWSTNLPTVLVIDIDISEEATITALKIIKLSIVLSGFEDLNELLQVFDCKRSVLGTIAFQLKIIIVKRVKFTHEEAAYKVSYFPSLK